MKRPIMVWVLVSMYATVVLVMILLSASNYPVQWRQQVNNERLRYVEVIMQALRYYVADYSGVLPPLPERASMIANTNACEAYCPALGMTIPCFDLSSTLVPGYMKEMLQDPLTADTERTGFYIMGEGRDVKVGACYSFFNQTLVVEEIL